VGSGLGVCKIRKFSSISRFEHESPKKVASLPSLGLDSRPRFSDLSFHSQLCLSHVIAAATGKNWELASMLKRPASAFRNLTPQFKASASQDWNGSPYSGTGLVPASAFFLSGTALIGCRTVRHSGIYKNCTVEEKGTRHVRQ
jgi:hypothetical protein